MAKSVPQMPRFEPFLLREQKDEHPQRAFNPVAHDFIVLEGNGAPRIAKNASVEQMITILRRSNSTCCGVCPTGEEDDTPLILMYAPCRISLLFQSGIDKAIDDSKKVNPLRGLLLFQNRAKIGPNYGPYSTVVATTLMA